MQLKFISFTNKFHVRKKLFDSARGHGLIIVGMSNEDRGPVETGIRDKLMSRLRPMYLDVVNHSVLYEETESSETHFAIVIVSSAFIGSDTYQRHCCINGILEKELASVVQSLTIVAKTPDEWRKENYNTPKPEKIPDSGINWPIAW